MQTPKRVLIISPFAGNIERNKKYLERCIQFVIDSGNAPFAPHYIYPNFLDDTDSFERQKGMAFGRAWAFTAEHAIAFIDYGTSNGMAEDVGFLRLERPGLPIDAVTIGENPDV